jgi:hypothetical protein
VITNLKIIALEAEGKSAITRDSFSTVLSLASHGVGTSGPRAELDGRVVSHKAFGDELLIR